MSNSGSSGHIYPQVPLLTFCRPLTRILNSRVIGLEYDQPCTCASVPIDVACYAVLREREATHILGHWKGKQSKGWIGNETQLQ